MNVFRGSDVLSTGSINPFFVQGEYFAKKGAILMLKHGRIECFHACVAGCGYKFEIPSQKVDTIHPNRPVKPPPVKKPPPPPFDSSKTTVDSSATTEDILSASA
ncbi:hypothetical protein RHMOL_Rhmol13G0235400 [Rhododendron molle]|uniref:Uncharacterized protein n=1 Tax=Rhododendron molle TaxID=49168 RepID=A0ACC0LBF1_RHOML|nr:hypothetical protein RHMOL_Rhmol13G0235400 [Rhododendron molle]